jgi:hypothetical protein
MLTGHRVLFSSAPLVAPAGARDGVLAHPAFPAAPLAPIFSIPFFLAELHASEEVGGSRPRVLCAFIAAQRRPLTATATEGTPRAHRAYREAQQNQRVYAMRARCGLPVYERKRDGRTENLSRCHATSLRT